MILDENDFLTFQLYTASKTPRVKRARIRGWIITTLSFLVFAYLFHQSGNSLTGNLLLILSVLSLALYPLYSRWRYKQHYVRYIRDTYKHRYGETCELLIDEDTIGSKDKSGIVKINKSEVTEVNEIKDYYFLKAQSGMTLIISKTKADNIEEIKDEIKSLVMIHGAKHMVELDWKWK